MTKQFEDYFSKAQTDMVAICMEYSEDQADDIFIYCSWEHNMYTFNVFFKAKAIVMHKHKLNEVCSKIDTSIERQRALLDIGKSNLDLINEICKEYNHDMPTEIKLHYNVKENSLKAEYKYDLVYSNRENLSSHDIFDAWFEEIKNKTE